MGCGPFVNSCLRSEELDNATWTKTNASTFADADTAPDGSTTAEEVILNNNVAAKVAQTPTVLNSTVYDWTFFYKRFDTSDHPFRARITAKDGSTQVASLTATSQWRRAHVSLDSATGGTSFELALIQLASPTESMQLAIWGSQLTARGSTHVYNGQHMPYFRRTDSLSASTRSRDEMSFAADDVPGQVLRGKFAISFLPLFSSAEIAAQGGGAYDYLLAIEIASGTAEGRTAGLRITDDSGDCVVQWCDDSGDVVCSRVITFDAMQELTFTLDCEAATMTVEGATTGDGTDTADESWNITRSTMKLGGGKHIVGMSETNTSAFGYVSEVRSA